MCGCGCVCLCRFGCIVFDSLCVSLYLYVCLFVGASVCVFFFFFLFFSLVVCAFVC